MSTSLPSLAASATALAASGYKIFPLPVGMKANRGGISKWQDAATSDPAQVAAWWTASPEANIGEVSNGQYFTVDIDPRNGGDVSLAALEAEHGKLPPTYTVSTPSGGTHMRFVGSVPNSASRVGLGIDIKSANSYVLAPPSRTVAGPGQSAGEYRTTDSRAMAPAPDWLLKLCGPPAANDGPTRAATKELLGGQYADLKSALAHPALRASVGSNGEWSKIGYALVPLGDIGRELWVDFSEHAANDNPGGHDTADTWWLRHAGSKIRSDYKYIFKRAGQLGWANPNPGGDPGAVGFGKSPLPLGASAERPQPPTPAVVDAAPPPSPGVLLTRADSITPVAISWLWKKFVARGKLAILAGHGGTGKSNVTLSLAAVASNGGMWPDGTRLTAAENVLIWSGEDAVNDTIVPRLIAMGADLKRVLLVSGGKMQDGSPLPFDPARDMPKLHAAIRELGGAALLIIDPIVSAVAGDMHRANDVRRALQAVVDLAEQFECAVIGISHFTKGSSKSSPVERVLGSQAFSALARVVLLCAKDDEDDTRVFMRAKSNIGPDRDGFLYKVVGATLPNPANPDAPIETTRIEWGEFVSGNASEILGSLEPQGEQAQGDEDDCVPAMRVLLTGPKGESMLVPSAEITASLVAAGYSDRRIRKARAVLGVLFEDDGKFPRRVFWKLPRQPQPLEPGESFIPSGILGKSPLPVGVIAAPPQARTGEP